MTRAAPDESMSRVSRGYGASSALHSVAQPNRLGRAAGRPPPTALPLPEATRLSTAATHLLRRRDFSASVRAAWALPYCASEKKRFARTLPLRIRRTHRPRASPPLPPICWTLVVFLRLFIAEGRRWPSWGRPAERRGGWTRTYVLVERAHHRYALGDGRPPLRRLLRFRPALGLDLRARGVTFAGL